MATRKNCPVCDNAFLGRKNRIYCTLACKSQANNERQEIKKRFENSVIATLVRNRAILLGVMSNRESFKVDKDYFEEEGYDLSYFTSLYRHRNELMMRCFEFGVSLSNGQLKIIRLKTEEPSIIEMHLEGVDKEFMDMLFSSRPK